MNSRERRRAAYLIRRRVAAGRLDPLTAEQQLAELLQPPAPVEAQLRRLGRPNAHRRQR